MTNVDFSGTWRNQRGSTMAITQNSHTGVVTGSYTTLVGSGESGILTKPLVGQAHGDQIVFFVDWWPYSMTVWAGQLLTQRSGGEALETVWTNTKDVSDSEEPTDGWAGLRTGGDSFVRTP